MTAPDPALSYGTPPTNKAAKVALILALLSWIPGVGIASIVAGLMAGQQARASGGHGRGRALMAVVFGIGSLFLWAMLAGAYFQGKALMYAKPAIEATPRFIMLVGSGNVSAAKGMCTDAIDIDRLTATAVQFQDLGSFVGNIEPLGGQPLKDRDGVEVNYRLPFAKGAYEFSTDWVFIDGQPRLADYRMTAAPTTQPAK